jgi:hypothetical protein
MSHQQLLRITLLCLLHVLAVSIAASPALRISATALWPALLAASAATVSQAAYAATAPP